MDEFHHAAAPTYQKLLSHYQPRILLGLTATPERMDGKSVLSFFDHRIAAEIRLPEAIDRKLLCPFQYFGVTDTVDLDTLRILIEAPNILLLDEPTNDLDIQTLMILEQFLESFQGAVIAVAHDRYFLDKVADHIFRLDGEGNVQVFLGGYSDYLLQQEDEEAPRAPKAAKPKAPRSEQPKKLKFTFKEQREYETIDDDIAALEEQIAGKEREIEASSSDFERLQQLLEEKEALEAALSEKEERWLYLTELAEKINNQ